VYVSVFNINKCGMKNKLSMEIDVSASLPEGSSEAQKYVAALSFSPDEKLLAVVLNDSRVLVYRWSAVLTTGKASKLICQTEI
jgi:hypothetical protein